MALARGKKDLVFQSAECANPREQLSGIKTSKRLWFYGFTIFMGVIFSGFLGSNYPEAQASDWLEIINLTTLFFAGLIVILAYIFYSTQRSNIFLYLSVGFFLAGSLDGYYFLLGFHFKEASPRVIGSLLPWTWFLSTTSLSLMMVLCMNDKFLKWVYQKKTRFEVGVYLASSCVIIMALLCLNGLDLPMGYYPKWVIPRPEMFFPALMFLSALYGGFKQRQWNHDILHHMIVIATILLVLMNTIFLPISREMYDGLFFGAHFLKVLAYAAVLMGLMLAVRSRFITAIQNSMQLQTLNKNLEQVNSDLEDFASIASHDLKEPLRKVQMFSTLLDLECREKLSGDPLSYLDGVVSSVERMSRLIESLLVYSQITRKSRNLACLDLNMILEETIAFLQPIIEKHGAVVKVETILPSIYGDRIQIAQLFQNIINNSLHFRKQDISPVVVVSSTTQVADSYLGRCGERFCEITISDNGIGIEDKYFNKIMRIFQRLNPESEYKGTGIGLTICKKIIERHGGAIRIQSKIGVGTDVIISLPLEG